MSPSAIRGLLFLLFAVSGFSGLIYESIWARYLQLFLGHAAYAQTLVLTIFMGGMAAGAWLAARYSPRWRNLLYCYAVVEGLIAVFGVAFHKLFVGVMGYAFDAIIPALGSAVLIQLVKWSLAGLLILPQSVLLGATFPLMSAAVVRRFPQVSGRSVALLYFTNSLGAAVGVLVAGFALVAWAGLPGTVLSAALLNLFLAVVLWAVSRTPGWTAPAMEAPSASSGASAPTALLVVAAITGTASFMYEIGWIRMLSLVMGSSTHAFELMLSAFILGLALGSFWIRRRIDALTDAVRFLGGVQVLMGVLALSTLLSYGATFEWMSALLHALARTAKGYVAFNVASHGMAIVIMVPTTFCAGMTLPLITQHLLRSGGGERAIGHVYAANTVGAIAGIILTVHAALPLLGLKGVIVSGAALDIGLGVYLIHRLASTRPRYATAISAVGAAALVFAIAGVELDSTRMAAGVYRTGRAELRPDAEVIFHRDGKTATVDVVRYASMLVISTNGKPDASVMTTPDPDAARNGDVQTQVLVAELPLAARPDARNAVVVGFGSGFTTHVLLGSPVLERVTTVEIEPAMIAGARRFRPANARALDDPRSVIEIEDAKTFFASSGRKFDLIVSEPSNPWVSGVAGLFSQEFYALVKRYLQRGGVLCQWLHLYEIDDALVASVLLALEDSFAEYEVYMANDGDLVILASDEPVTLDFDFLFSAPMLAQELKRIDVHDVEDLKIRRLGSRALLAPLFASYTGAANSDYFPVLDLETARTRFMNVRAHGYLDLTVAPIPLIEMLDRGGPRVDRTSVSLNRQLSRAARAHFAMAVRDFVATPDFGASTVKLRPQGKDVLLKLLADWQRCGRGEAEDDFWIRSLLDLADATVPYLKPAELDRMWTTLQGLGCDFSTSPRRKRWFDLVRAVSARDAPAMVDLADLLLAQAAQPAASEPREDQLTEEQVRRLRYLVMAGMTGNLVRNDPDAALALWQRSGATLAVNEQPPPALRLLIAQAAEQMSARDALAAAP